MGRVKCSDCRLQLTSSSTACPYAARAASGCRASWCPSPRKLTPQVQVARLRGQSSPVVIKKTLLLELCVASPDVRMLQGVSEIW